jgi:hypothetical protein
MIESIHEMTCQYISMVRPHTCLCAKITTRVKYKPDGNLDQDEYSRVFLVRPASDDESAIFVHVAYEWISSFDKENMTFLCTELLINDATLQILSMKDW